MQNFFSPQKTAQNICLQPKVCVRFGGMFKSLPLTAREVRATEARLQAVYEAARLGLRGDNLAFAAGLLPVEYRRMCELDPVIRMAEEKGRADGELEAAGHLREAARGGDAKAALAILQNVHGWVAKQQVQVDVTQQISVVGALQRAEGRVLEGKALSAGAGHALEARATALDAVPEAVR